MSAICLFFSPRKYNWQEKHFHSFFKFSTCLHNQKELCNVLYSLIITIMIPVSAEIVHDTLMAEISAWALHVAVHFRCLFIAVLLSLHCHSHTAGTKQSSCLNTMSEILCNIPESGKPIIFGA